MSVNPDTSLEHLTAAIRNRDHPAIRRLLHATPALAVQSFLGGGTRQEPKPHYAGDTALHVAASVYDATIITLLLSLGAHVGAVNRRGATPLHAAAMGQPGAAGWNPSAQTAAIATLIEAGANPNARDKLGATPLHKAVRTRCSAAVEALLRGGADISATNDSGSTPYRLAGLSTGRGGSGSPAAKAEQAAITRILRQHGAA